MSSTVVGREIAIRGTVRGEEDLEIHGLVVGRLETSGALLVSEGGRVHADINADRVVVRGEIRCKVVLANIVEILSGAVLEADVRAPRVLVEEGARVRGHIDTASEREELIDAVLNELGSSEMQVYAQPRWSKHSGGAHR